MVAVPKKAASQFITPDDGFMSPAAAGATEYVTVMLLSAVAEYVSFTASWHSVMAPAVKAVAPVVGFTVTTLVAVVVPQRPAEEAVIVAAPVKAAFQFMTPVAGSIVPAPAGSTEYVIDVLFSAAAVYVSSGASWQTVMAPEVKVVAPVDGFTVTTLSAVVVPQRPDECAVMVAVPKKAASQFIDPVPAFITPAVHGNTE
jgi:hypothetical protein